MAATAARVLSSIQSNDIGSAQYNAVADVLARTGPQLPADSSAPSALSRTFEAVSDLQQFLLDRLVRLGGAVWRAVLHTNEAPCQAESDQQVHSAAPNGYPQNFILPPAHMRHVPGAVRWRSRVGWDRRPAGGSRPLQRRRSGLQRQHPV